jgi:hypothetical protein
MNIFCSRGVRRLMRLAGSANYKVAIVVRDTQSDTNLGGTIQGASQS